MIDHDQRATAVSPRQGSGRKVPPFGPPAKIFVILVVLALAGAVSAEAQTGYLSVDQITSAPLGPNDRSVVVLIHGWTGKDLQHAPPNKYAQAEDADWYQLVQVLRTRLSGTGSRLLLFHWEDDASTGGVGLYQTGFYNAASAASNAFSNGSRLASALDGAAPDLRRVTFVAHSAGAWAAYRAADRLLLANPYVVVNIVLLDPFVPGANSNFATPLTTGLMGLLAGASYQDRIYRLENYFSIDVTDIDWVSGGWNVTSQQFSWRSKDINQEVDYPSADPIGSYGGPVFDLDGIGHSGPKRFYADTVIAATAGKSVPAGLVYAPWSFTAVGFYRGLVYESFLLPSITVQPTAPSQPVGAGSQVSISVSANRASSYQWFKNESKINGATSSTLPFASVTVSDAGTYVVRVGNVDGYTFSEKAVLQVNNTCTTFSLNPTSASPNSGANSTIVTITGSPAGCSGGNWNTAGNGSWITVSPASGSGSGSATVSWTQNSSTTSRSGSATIAGNSLNVIQSGTGTPTCTSFSTSPTSASPSSAAGGTGVTITGLPAGCTGGSWTASGSGSWITVSPASGSGSGGVTVSWQQNTSTSSRSGNATIASNNFAVNQSGTGTATVELVTNGTFASATTGWTRSGYFYFDSAYTKCRSCPGYAYLAYNGLPGDNLSGHLFQTVTIPSNATSASLGFWTFIETTESTSSAAYDTLSLYIENTSGGLLGTAASLSNLSKSTGYVQRTFDLLSIASPGQTVVLHFYAKTDGTVTGATNYLPTIFRVDDVSILATTVTLPPTCTSFSISPTSAGPTAEAGSTGATVTGSPAGCTGGSWVASGNGSWLTVSPASGSGSGAATVSWAQNTATSSRWGSATIANNGFTVTQGAAAAPTCTSFSISPTSANPGAAAGSQNVTITGAPSGCTGGNWTTSGNGSWLTVSPASGTGSGAATVSWAQNSATSARSDSTTIANIGFAVSQSGTASPACTSFSVSPTAVNPSAAPGSQNVTITGAPAGCTSGNWAASGNGSWLMVSPASGSGSGSVTASWTQNIATSSRFATATIANTSFAVTQSAPRTQWSPSLSNHVQVAADGGQQPRIRKFGGNIYIANGDNSASRNLMFYKSTNNGATFTSTSLASPVMNSFEYDFGMDASGNLFVLWEDQNDDQLRIRTSLDAGVTWSASMVVASGFSWMDEPSSYCANGAMYLLFRGSKNQQIDLYFTKSTNNGASFSTPVAVTNNSTQEDSGKIAVVGNNVYAVYYDGYSVTSGNTYLVTSSNGGVSFGGPVQVNRVSRKSDFGPALAVDSSGAVFIAYSDTSSDGEGDLYVAKTVNSGGSFSYVMAADSTYRGQAYPRMMVDTSNVIHLVWNDNRDNTSYGSVYYTRSVDAGASYAPNVSLRSSGGISNGAVYVDADVAYLAVTDYKTSPFSTKFLTATWVPSTPMAGLPGAPTGVSVTAGNSQLAVNWVAPASNGGAAITRYTATASPGGATCTWVGGPITCTVTGLTNGTAYTVTVTATNSAGTGAASNPSASTTPRTVPGAPISVSAAPGNGRATLTWVAPASSGGAAITDYTVTATPGGARCAWPSGPLTCVVTGLTNGTPYTFTVTATNNAGTGVESSPSVATTPRTVPGAPTGVSATAGNGQVVVNWVAPASTGGAMITSYTVTATPGGATCAWTGGQITCTVTGLTNGTAYTFTVIATNIAGSGVASNPSAAATPRTVPGPPTGVSVTAGNGQLRVNWVAPASNGGAVITGYAATASPGGATCTWVGGPITCAVMGLTNGTAYTFTVTATNSAGTGAASLPSAPTTPRTVPGWPTDLSVAAGNGRTVLSWTAPGSTGGAAITSYIVKRGTTSRAETTLADGVTATSFTDTSVIGGMAYYYVVSSVNVAGEGATSAEVVFVAFSDDQLEAGIARPKAVHTAELRHHIDILRTRYGLAAFAWTDPTITAGVTLIKAAHVAELRTALDAVYVAAGRTRPAYSPSAVSGSIITAAHIAEIRAAIRAIY